VIDNSALIADFCPASNDGDTFIYTEMLDRSKRKGNNGQRLLKTFYHRSRDEFWEQWPTIRKLCDLANVRACTRLSPRSYRKVGATFTKLVVEAALTDNFAGMKSLYNRACGITAPNEKLWLLDVDAEDAGSRDIEDQLRVRTALIARIPSRRAFHLIVRPLDLRLIGYSMPADGYVLPNVQLHKDNPTNLYIPDEAA
jgi:hypothetical protein